MIERQSIKLTLTKKDKYAIFGCHGPVISLTNHFIISLTNHFPNEMICWSACLSVYPTYSAICVSSPVHSLRMTRVFHKASRLVAKASELITSFKGFALEGGLNGGVGFYFGLILQNRAYSGWLLQFADPSFNACIVITSIE